MLGLSVESNKPRKKYKLIYLILSIRKRRNLKYFNYFFRQEDLSQMCARDSLDQPGEKYVEFKSLNPTGVLKAFLPP